MLPALVVNLGSSSLKAAVIDRAGVRLWQGQGPGGGEAAPWLAEQLEPWRGQLALAAHRVVHGGEHFSAPARITPELVQALEALVPLAPLHNGPALALIRALIAWDPALSPWACFDTAFHHHLPEAAFTYALPASWRARGLRRFGFHGLNHQHVSETVADRLGHPGQLRLISCHLGAGCSLAAIQEGRSIDTTMGYTPLEGLVMASRSGSVDPGLLLHLMREGLPVDHIDHALTRESGLLGLSELSGDWAELRQAAATHHRGAQLALEVFQHRLLAGIGAMAASLNGVDAIALSGGIGANDRLLEEELKERLGWLGPLHWFRIPADEEGLMARQCLALAAAA
ncbi:acetate/propionate family kinase [Cyanobium sp. Morenito 9A2]|uniref:acetate/propionate family kinase n=1 Tax=Cyanobium sp. Morenito 9A2 TaxID=2823718 RepID=UPI0020CE2F9A|nr:acetate kinase [Cyanobium sp. Morenito 9A2]MCP9849529.1 acetate kinase [Cyanobium sp. Morenito 9A2]